MVLCNSFRNPALLAKMAATLDVASKGRLEFGVGAGIQRDEHLAYGMPFGKSSVRIGRLKEALEVIRMLWTREQTNFDGEFYKLKDAVCEPKPLQKPHPPITIGGSGEKLTLRVTAQYADRFDWAYLPLPLYKHKLNVLRNYCTNAGRNFQEIEKSCWPGSQIFVARDQQMLDAKLSLLKPRGATSDFEKNSLVGAPDVCLRRIQQYADLGATYFILAFGDMPSVDGLRVFAEMVASAVD